MSGLDDVLDDAPEEPTDDKPFDDEPFDAGVEADEDTDPAKFIQQLAGKLGQSLRQYTEDQGQPDFDLEKFAVNSVLSATHTSEMDQGDQKDIINKVKGAGKDDEDSTDGEDLGGDEPTDEPSGDDSMDFGEEPVEEIKEELPLSGDDLPVGVPADGGLAGCDKVPSPIDSKAVDILKDMTESENDMMLSNLKNMKTDAEKILSMDKDKLDKKLRGMDWADDHISTSTDDTEEVADYLTSEGENPCWDGYEKVAGKKDYEKGSCKKVNEGNLNKSKKNSIFVDKTKLVEKLRLMENTETAPVIEPKPVVKPDVKPARPMRETERPFLPKRRDKVQPDPKGGAEQLNEIGGNTVEFNGKEVDVNSLEIEGVDRMDYPDFVDAFFSAGNYTDGTPMDDVELENFTQENGELINELIFDRQMYL